MKKNMLIFDTTNFTAPDSDGRPAVRFEEVEVVPSGDGVTDSVIVKLTGANTEANNRIIEDGIADTEEEKTRRLAAEARVGQLEAALKAVEWRKAEDGQERCNYCNHRRQYGHRLECCVDEALEPARQAEGESGVEG